MITTVKLIAPSLPSGYCYPSDPQDFANDLFTNASAQLVITPTQSYYNFGSSVPAANLRIFPWYRTGADEMNGWYYWGVDDGISAWIRPHPTPPSSSERRIWVGTTASVVTYDGGESATVNDYSGPMWEVDTAFDARFMLGAGTLPSGTAVAALGTGGEETHSLLSTEMPPHKHNLDQTMVGADVRDTAVAIPIKSSSGGDPYWSSLSSATSETGGSSGVVVAHNNMPPYIGVYVIKRTARIFYRV